MSGTENTDCGNTHAPIYDWETAVRGPLVVVIGGEDEGSPACPCDEIGCREPMSILGLQVGVGGTGVNPH